MKRTLVDLLLILSGIAFVLLAFIQVSAKADKREPEPVVTVPALPDPTVSPEPTPEPDEPAYNPVIPLSEDLQYILWASCEENNVDLAIALGLIEVESGFDADADGGLCYGLMQLNRKYFPSGLPAGENIQYGLEYLGQLLVRYDTVEAALTAYNAGHDTGSRAYANAVLAAAEKWRGANG